MTMETGRNDVGPQVKKRRQSLEATKGKERDSPLQPAEGT